MGKVLGRMGRVAGLCAIALLGLTSIAAAATTGKPYSLVIAPGATSYETGTGTAPNGSTVGLEASGTTSSDAVQTTATFTNETKTQQLGSADLFWPAGFSVLQDASHPITSSDGTANLSSKCSYLGVPSGACVELRSLSLAPGGSFTVSMWITTPACMSGAQGWFAEVKQANNYSGSPGNDFSFDTGASQPDTLLDGACSLQFGNQPADTRTGQAISDTAYTPPPGGAGIAVNVLGSNGQTVTTSTLPVTMALGSNPGLGQLGGGTTERANGGTATFSSLTVSAPADGYTLQSSSGALGGATSGTFSVNDQAVFCSTPGSLCTTTDGPSNGNHAQVQATVTSGSGFLTESVNPDGSKQLTCAGNTSPATDPNTYQSLTPSAWSKVVTTTIVPTKKLGKPTQVLKSEQICFGDPTTPFTTASGTPSPFVTGGLPNGQSGYIGLLQTCTGSTVGPCIDRQASTTVSDPSNVNGFDIVLVFDIPANFAGDPFHT
jgi:hypothetical protein